MSLGSKLNSVLNKFEEKTAGVLGSVIIGTRDALSLAVASNHFDEGAIQTMSSKLLTVSSKSLEDLLGNYKLYSVTIEEENHFIYIRQVNEDYHVVVITDKSEMAGIREMNIKELITRLKKILDF